ncbi:pyridoxal phosphate-dependent decarboxylase family protein [Lacimicrobium alkaliphilum]|uniref:Pyridoxal-dependent decarboxylase n=1 Tax=Lacimicrobium alkaliphilum TaxID=1526571 RepID=A0A0U3AWZ0_9ALTE|nr:aminotransferase class V-fold PLP-dependent enzyme [Lacimicrobium alkaliphilum]ALS97408.1 pyridoxal-dependent decarboxylase [Lacimicrobium alkaliphilum]
MTELDLLKNADHKAGVYTDNIGQRPAFPSEQAIACLSAFEQPLSEQRRPPTETLAMLDKLGSEATVASNGGRYFGFVLGASLPVAAAAERLALAWDQCASSAVTSPVAHAIERAAARLVLEALDLPAESAVNFGTSASACGLVCLHAARRALLKRKGWDLDRQGLTGAPPIRVVLTELAHITVIKALRVLGFGLNHLEFAKVDQYGRLDPQTLPDLDADTILCLQAGEVNTGECDPFAELIPRAKAAGAWVHVDGAFGLWARASSQTRHLTNGIELADSWTTDGHKWLNTPYDGAIGICRDAVALAEAMNSNAVYSSSGMDSQENLGLEFSRRARGIPIWAALHSLGRQGLAEQGDRYVRLAKRLAQGLEDNGFTLLNRVVLNQVLVRLDSDQATQAVREQAISSGEIWFGQSVWRGRPALRLSVCSWRTTEQDIDTAVAILAAAKAGI